ncbi:hypothetical protein [Bacteroides fragilis]|uniref:hypothetical protein n=1 Tax=Bacteroides fragilis TaxID=817 RepID=UPI00189CEC72|nr:hypothetical protein [Bacteroides fragilis]
MKQKTQKQLPLSPSTRTYNELLYKVDTRRGAPMGRPDVGDRSQVTGQRIFCRRVYLPIDGAYDKGGAYWGCGAPLYVEFTLDKSYVHFFRK